MNKLTLSAALIAAAALSSSAFAQFETGAGVGRVTRPPLDLNTPTQNNFSGGVAYANGLAYVAQRGGRNDPNALPPHSLVAIDLATGGLVAESHQVPGSHGTVWGFRDGDSDARVPGNTTPHLMFGNERGIFVIDPATMGSVGSPRRDVQLASTLEAANGTQNLVANPIAIPGTQPLTVYRGVAYDPNGDGGNGSIWTANFLGPLFEIDLTGRVLRQFPNQAVPNEWNVYGLALDPVTGNLWANASQSNAVLAEIDTTTGLLTGRTIRKAAASTTQGGLDIVPGGLDGRGCGYDLVALDQGLPDTLTGYRLHLWNNWTNDMEVDLQIGFDNRGVAPDDADVPRSAMSLEYQLIDSTRMPIAAAFFLDFEPISLSDRPAGPLIPPAQFQSLFELRRTFAGIIFNDVSRPGIATSVPISIGGATGITGVVAIQAVTVDFNVPDPGCGTTLALAVTPQRRWTLDANPPCGVEVEARGPSSFNVDPTSGFFRVTNNSGLDIDDITFTWMNSPNPAQVATVFDCNEASTAGTFWNGNGAASSCRGTYRNGSDVTTGLDYGASQINLRSPCNAPGENSGAQGADPTVAPSYKTLTWRFNAFSPGLTFEVDIDTDGAFPGSSGDLMDGMRVLVNLSDGRLCEGVLTVDRSVAQRSAVIL